MAVGSAATTNPEASTTWQGLSGGLSGRRSGQSGNQMQRMRAIVLQFHELFDPPRPLARRPQGEATPKQGTMATVHPFPCHRARLYPQVEHPGGQVATDGAEYQGGPPGPRQSGQAA